jgi:hypothetical protein
MATLQTQNGCSAPTKKYALKSTEETLAELNREIDSRHFKTRKQGSITVSYVPWPILAKHLHHRAPGWNWEIQNIQQIGDSVCVIGRLTIPTSDSLLHFSAVSSVQLNGKSMAPAVETAASNCLRRACGLSGLGLNLWLES